MKAFIRENNVEFVESREPLSRYYPAGLLPFFVDVPDELAGEVSAGWRYADGQFTEPEIMSAISTIGGYYLPNDKAKTVEFIVDTVNAKEKEIRQVENTVTETEQEAIALGQLVTESELKALEVPNDE